MPRIPVELLIPHPDNANRMNDAMLAKLSRHIERTGKYPPVIVRPHPTEKEKYQILDGHHRLLVLQQMGHNEAECDVWELNDDDAALMLLTLNRLHGEDDPQKRGALLSRLKGSLSLPEMIKLLPDDAKAIEKLIDLTKAAPALAPPMNADDMPQAVTFFLKAAQRKKLFDALREVHRDRSQALMIALNLEPLL